MDLKRERANACIAQKKIFHERCFLDFETSIFKTAVCHIRMEENFMTDEMIVMRLRIIKSRLKVNFQWNEQLFNATQKKEYQTICNSIRNVSNRIEILQFESKSLVAYYTAVSKLDNELCSFTSQVLLTSKNNTMIFEVPDVKQMERWRVQREEKIK